MSAFTTLDITALDARQRLIRKILATSDLELETMMDAAFRNETLYNFNIVSDYEHSDEYRRYDESRF